MKRLLANPHGLDLGPLQETLPARLQTKDKAIDLAPSLFVDALPTLERELDPARATTGPQPLELIGRRHLRSNNSWLHNSARLMKGKNRCTLMMHPSDAAARELTHGQQVEVHNHIGQVSVELEVTEAIMPGVVSLPHGFGHTTATRLSVATAFPGVNHNALTDTAHLDHISGNAAFSGTPVHIRGVAS
ncbi:MAG TPA: molybdopterin dinucleotide binding domain-containing protein [Myxococcota bacterium]|nr:molybdopterin dinucleotide binding domain-containing protein [Myxococcota bacterium]